jgi:Tfp pilus assembly protein PilF
LGQARDILGEGGESPRFGIPLFFVSCSHDFSPRARNRRAEQHFYRADLALAEEYVAPGLAVPGDRAKLMRKALAENPSDPEVLTGMAFLYQTQGKLQQARQLYERALQIEPLETATAADLGVIAAQSGRLKEAEQLWERAFEREPSNIAIGLNLSRVLWQEGEHAKARQEIKRLLEFNPDLPEAKTLLQEWSRRSSDFIQH